MKKIFTEGFILPFTMLICAIVLFVTTGAMTLLSKQLYFSKLYKQTQVAYYAADDALMCAIDIDDGYVAADGLGLFPSDSTIDGNTYIDNVLTYVNDKRTQNSKPVINRDQIACAKSYIFDTTFSQFAISPTPYTYVSNVGTESGRTATFNMRMDVGGGETRCAKVTINKTASFRQIIAQGYSKCDSPVGSVERAVINTTITQ